MLYSTREFIILGAHVTSLTAMLVDYIKDSSYNSLVISTVSLLSVSQGILSQVLHPKNNNPSIQLLVLLCKMIVFNINRFQKITRYRVQNQPNFMWR